MFITRSRANAALSDIHSRMPVILPTEVEGAWLDGDAEVERLLSMLQPYPGERMSAYPVSTLVNNPVNDRRDIIRAA
jgi:putative SOS response-associated peptidase YedK